MRNLPGYKPTAKSIKELVPVIVNAMISGEIDSPSRIAEMRDSIWTLWDGCEEWLLMAFIDGSTTFLLDPTSDFDAVVSSKADFVLMSENLVQMHDVCHESDNQPPTQSLPSSVA